MPHHPAADVESQEPEVHDPKAGLLQGEASESLTELTMPPVVRALPAATGTAEQTGGGSDWVGVSLSQLSTSFRRQEEALSTLAAQHATSMKGLSRQIEERFADLEQRLQPGQVTTQVTWPAILRPPPSPSTIPGVPAPPEDTCPEMPPFAARSLETSATFPMSTAARRRSSNSNQSKTWAPSTQRDSLEPDVTATSSMKELATARTITDSPSVKSYKGKNSADRVRAFEDVEDERRKFALEVGFRSRRGMPDPDAEEELPDTKQNRVRRWVNSPRFDLTCALVVAANAAYMGITVEEIYLNGSVSTQTEVVELCFLIFYIVELALRVYAIGIQDFLFGKDAGWNLTDCLIVAVSVVYRLLQGTSRSFTVVRVLRNMRMVRILRVVRVTRFFKQLRMLIYAIGCTLKTCMWTILLLCVFIYMFAIAIGQMVAYYVTEEQEHNREIDSGLERYFSSLAEVIFTLFMSVSGGIDWESAARPLMDVGWPCLTLFIFYIVVVVLCVMNLMTGIFVESAMDAAQSDRDHVINCELEEAQKYKKSLTDLFEQWDVSGDQNLTITEFEKHLSDGRVKALFRTLEIDPSDAWTFFKLLDRDNSGIVSLDEFINGCVKLKGGATGFHMERIQYETRYLMEITNQILEAVSELSATKVHTDESEAVKRVTTSDVSQMLPILLSAREGGDAKPSVLSPVKS